MEDPGSAKLVAVMSQRERGHPGQDAKWVAGILAQSLLLQRG